MDYRSVIYSLAVIVEDMTLKLQCRPLQLIGHECLLRKLLATETNVGRANGVRYHLTRIKRKEEKDENMDKHVTALLGSNSLPAQPVSVSPGAVPSLQGEDVGEASA